MTHQDSIESLDDAAFIERMRIFSVDHEPNGWPAVQMHQITRLCDLADANIQAVKALREENERLRGICAATQQESADMTHSVVALGSQLAELQAKYDALMLEFCPDEMTADQLQEWGTNQVPESQLAELRQGGEAVGEVVLESMGVGDAKVVRFHMYKEIPPVGTKLFTRPQPAIPPGYVQVPDWHGYALLGTGRYILNASPPPMDPDLGAEFCITLATDEDRSDNRQIGEIRDNTRTTPYQPEEIAIRIGFLTPQALDAMEAQLTILRKDHWPETISPSVPVAEKDASEYQRGFKDGYQRRDDEVMGSLA